MQIKFQLQNFHKFDAKFSNYKFSGVIHAVTIYIFNHNITLFTIL